jgi:hypothetical protein
MDVASNAITAVVTLAAVVLGGWVAEKEFVAAARTELGLSPDVPTSLDRHLATLEG